MLVAGKIFVVTGGGNGIGRAVVLALVAKGARVAAVDIREAGLSETLALAGSDEDRISTHVVDLTDRAAVEAVPVAVTAAHGAVDGVINVAGIIQGFTKVQNLGLAEIDRVMDVNFYGPLNITKAFLPLLLTRPEAHIVAVSSMGGFLPVPGQTAYGASKAAVKLLFEGLHSELRATNVGVTVVFPGAIATDIAANSGVSMPAAPEDLPKGIRMTSASAAAEQILRGIERRQYRVLVGADAKLMDLFCRLMPERAARAVYRKMGSLLPG